MIGVLQNFILHFALAGLFAALAILAFASLPNSFVARKVCCLWQKNAPANRIIIGMFLLASIVYAGTKSQVSTMSFKPSGQREFKMPETAMNWNIRGAWRDFCRFTFDDGWEFPYATNSLKSIEVISYGDIWPHIKNNDAIATLGENLEIVRNLSSFDCEYTPSNTYKFTWAQCAINRDTNNLVTSSIELFRNGDIMIVTNGVGRYQKRINPYDIDGDGLANEKDARPSAYDGDYFGKGNPLPENANESAYYYLNVCATGVLDAAYLTVTCDKPSNLGNHVVILRSNEYCSIPLLAGAVYEVECDQEIADCFASSKYAQFKAESPNKFVVTLPLDLSFVRSPVRAETMAFTPMTSPHDVAAQVLEIDGACCSCITNGAIITWTCQDNCACNAYWHELATTATWEGYTYTFMHREWCPCFLKDHNDVDGLIFNAPTTFFTNNDGGAEDSDIAQLTVGLISNMPTNGTLALMLANPGEGVNVYETTNRENEVEWPISWNVQGGSMRNFYVEGASVLQRGGNSFILTWQNEEGETLLSTNVPFAVYSPIVNVINNTLYDGSRLCNPSAIATGTNACFAIEFDEVHPPASEIKWAVVEGEAAFSNTNLGERVYVQSSQKDQMVKLRVQIGDCKSRPPEITAFVVDPLSVKLTVRIVRDDFGYNAPRTPTEVTNMVNEVNKIYEQIGVNFYIDSISFTNRSDWLDLSLKNEEQKEIRDRVERKTLVDIVKNSNGLELYFVEKLFARVLGDCDVDGIVLSNRANANVLAHEIGHAFQIGDIYPYKYVNGTRIHLQKTLVEYSCAEEDWNNGSGTRYYPNKMQQKELVKRLLMCGYSYPLSKDLSLGPIYGFSKGGVESLLNVGFFTNGRRKTIQLSR